MAIGKKTGGRKKGTQNKSTVAEAEAIAASGETPKQYMLRVMRDRKVDHARRDEMAKAVAPYIHAKLSATEVTGPDGGPIQTEDLTDLSDTDIGRRIAFLLTKGAKSVKEKP